MHEILQLKKKVGTLKVDQRHFNAGYQKRYLQVLVFPLFQLFL